MYIKNHWSLFEFQTVNITRRNGYMHLLQGGGSTPPQLTPHTIPLKAEQILRPVRCCVLLHQTHQTPPLLLLLSAVTALSLVP